MLDRFKVARIDSALSPSSIGKPPPMAPPVKKPFISSQGDRMRSETSNALERGLKVGALAALERFGLKTAQGMTTAIPAWHQDLMFAHHGMPSGAAPTPSAPASAAHPSVSWGDFHQGLGQHLADNHNPSAAPAPQQMSASAARHAPLAPHLGTPASAAQPMSAPPAAAAGAAGAAGAASRFGLGGAKRMLGLGALGALGAGAWGMHRQHQQDLAGDRLTYAPTQGGFY